MSNISKCLKEGIINFYIIIYMYILKTGGKVMFEELKFVFKVVIDLANDYESYHDKYGMKSLTVSPSGMQELKEFKNSSEGKELEKRENALYYFLKALDYEVIKAIQVVMYLGRDQDYDKNDTPEKIYSEYRHYFGSKGWDEKDIIINTVTEKISLGKYLQDGLGILGVRV